VTVPNFYPPLVHDSFRSQRQGKSFMHPVAYSLGSLIGSFIIVSLLSYLWERFLFQKVMDDPVKGKLASVGAAWLTAGVIGGFGFANGGPYAWVAFGFYGVPAAVLAVFAYFRGLKLRSEQD